MQSDHVSLLARHLLQDPVPVSHITVRSAMKTVAPNAMAAVQVIRNRVQVSLLGKRVMKCRIEYRHLRRTRTQKCSRGKNPLDVIGIVKRGQFNAALDAL